MRRHNLREIGPGPFPKLILCGGTPNHLGGSESCHKRSSRFSLWFRSNLLGTLPRARAREASFLSRLAIRPPRPMAEITCGSLALCAYHSNAMS